MVTIKLSRRLEKLAEYVPKGARVVDIGTDHAYLPIYLLQAGLAEMVIASDIASGPVASARKNVQKYGLSKDIDIRLGEGLQTVTPGEVDVAIIAGMGGFIATQIMASSLTVVDRLQRIIIQPMNASHLIRTFFFEHGFRLIFEDVFRSEHRYYEMLVAEKKRVDDVSSDPVYQLYQHDAAWLQFAFACGPMRLQSPTPEFMQYLKSMVINWRRILTTTSASESVRAQQRQNELMRRLQVAEQWLKVHASMDDEREGGKYNGKSDGCQFFATET